MLVSVIQRDPIMRLPDRLGWCAAVDPSAAIAGAGLAAVAVLIRSLSTRVGCDPSQSCRSSFLQAGTDLSALTRRHHQHACRTGRPCHRHRPRERLDHRRRCGSRHHRRDRDGRFAATSDGYTEAFDWAEAHTEAGERAWAIEGTASYGRGLTAALTRSGEWVIEFDRPHQRATKDGAKSDELDAVRAAREVLGRKRLHQPRTHDGHCEALRDRGRSRSGRELTNVAGPHN